MRSPRTRQATRCAWLTSIALTIAPMTLQAATSATVGAAEASGESSKTRTIVVIVELVKALGWPLVVLVIALLYREEIARFISSIGGRVSKLSAFSVAIELASARAPSTTPLLDELRSATDPGLIGDSSGAMLKQVQSTAAADYALIHLGSGQEWLTSRLFIAAVMMERMRGAKVFVFTESAPAGTRQFLAVSDLRQLRWRLAQRYPWLETAYIRALAPVHAQDVTHVVTLRAS